MDATRAVRLGQKWTCFSCALRFYDLGKPVAVCPRCSANQKDAPPPPARVATTPRTRSPKGKRLLSKRS